MSAWQPIEAAPRDGTLLDVEFDPATALTYPDGLSAAEFYAPGSTRRRKPAPPVVRQVRWVPAGPGGTFGGWCPVLVDEFGEVDMHPIAAVTLTRWRLAERAP